MASNNQAVESHPEVEKILSKAFEDIKKKMNNLLRKERKLASKAQKGTAPRGRPKKVDKEYHKSASTSNSD